LNKSTDLWLVAISAGHWQKSGIQSAIDAGIRVLALDGDVRAEGFALATKKIVVDIRDPQAVLAAVKSTGIRPDGVVSFVSEIGMPAAALLREYYGLVGPNKEITHALLNKVRQREILQKAAIHVPQWRKFNTIKQAKLYIEELGYPCIVKPSDSSGSRGVTKLDSDEGLHEAVQQALNHSQSRTALIEAFMHGTEYTVETFGDGKIIHILAVTEKVKVSSTVDTVSRELVTPNSLTKMDIVADAAVEVLRTLGYLSGPGHTEIILNEQGQAGIVEAAGRGGGFMVFERLVEKASGFDIVLATALQAVELKIPKVINKGRSVMLRFFPSRKGIVKDINGFDEANQILGVEAEPLVSIGQHVGVVMGDGDRLGYIISEGSTPKEARIAADSAESLIKIEVI
jgi:biotin carboxylase